MDEHFSRVPWSTGPSIKQMSEEMGVDYDRFINGLKLNKSDVEMAGELGVSEKTVKSLREHFMTRGVGSIVGQD